MTDSPHNWVPQPPIYWDDYQSSVEHMLLYLESQGIDLTGVIEMSFDPKNKGLTFTQKGFVGGI